MKIIGLTGGIASGKSTVADILMEAGYTVVDCDKIVRQLSEPYREVWQIYHNRYGKDVINDDKSLNRQSVADIIFRDKSELETINGLIHPLIRDKMLLEADKARNNGATVIFLDVPLLFEAGFDKITDENWLVYVSKDIQLKRLMSRNGYSQEEALRRIDCQMSLDEKKQLADVVIYNDGDLISLRQQVMEKTENGQRGRQTETAQGISSTEKGI